jgi:hypothetical protein
VAETAGLENRCARKGTVGSNPTLSVVLERPVTRAPYRPSPSLAVSICVGRHQVLGQPSPFVRVPCLLPLRGRSTRSLSQLRKQRLGLDSLDTPRIFKAKRLLKAGPRSPSP